MILLEAYKKDLEKWNERKDSLLDEIIALGKMEKSDKERGINYNQEWIDNRTKKVNARLNILDEIIQEIEEQIEFNKRTLGIK